MAATRKRGCLQGPSSLQQGPGPQGGGGWAGNKLNCSQEESPSSGRGHPEKRTGVRGRGPTLARGQQSRPRKTQRAARRSPASGAPHPGTPRPAPAGTPAAGCAPRGSTYFVAGALGFVVAAGRHSLGGWRRHCSPGAGAHSPVPQLQHLPLPRGRGGLLRPETRTARRGSLAGLPSPRSPALHVPQSRAQEHAPTMEARPPRQVTPKTASTSERSRPPAASAAPGTGSGRAGQRRGRPPVARCASPRRGPGGKRRRGGEGRGRVTRFRAGARPLPAPPPASAGASPFPPFPRLQPPAPGHAPRPRPALLHCGSRGPASRRGVTS